MAKRELVIVTGMSGAGKRVAMDALEDIGFYSVDNLPPQMLASFWEMVAEDPAFQHAAVMIDLRSQKFFKDLSGIMQNLLKKADRNYDLKLIYIDASDETLVARYKETRRQHPLSGDKGTLWGIQQEREQLASIREMATEIIHTDELAARKLKQLIVSKYGDQEAQHNLFNVQVMSFGFKYGMPVDADLVVDVRFLPNPYYLKALRDLTGIDQAVSDYIWDNQDAKEFYQLELEQVKWLLPRYKAEGKTTLTIAFGCTGGQHRSVAFAHQLANDLKANWKVNEYHRDIERRREGSTRA
ncbi:ATP-binding protein [Weissella oryzae SG25]|uniref:ATP-binding protein n=1 Tax=Weissella oryzae (strain DSM 25784 / JCM 18191 / LMG 30913 / SG25) TaxID=1329250 RepID=A0A069CV76_WEIOS|nr:RNase adapter RapZ [Weissella oryzae]GAK31364.1 ATP-binding protein [Weissella oryzae SG25]